MYGTTARYKLLFSVFLASYSVYCLTVSYSDPSRCGVNQYFQISSLQCKNCAANMNKSTDGLSCVCKAGFYFVQNGGGDKDVQCSPCAANEITANDKWSCVKCPLDTSFDASTSTCKKQCNVTASVHDRQRNGLVFPDKRRQCITCRSDTQPDSKHSSCSRCHSSVIAITANLATGVSCVCPETALYTSRGGICFRKDILDGFTIPDPTATSNTYTVTYPQRSVVSEFFVTNLQAAKALCCLNRNFTACQLLANLCVMIDYNKDNFGITGTSNTDACSEFLEIVKCSSPLCSCGSFVGGLVDWPYYMPWLFYTTETANLILSKTDIAIKYKKGVTLRFAVAIYSSNGSFLGLQNDTKIFQMCQERETKSSQAFSFLTTYSITCSVPLQKLKTMDTLFYDLYYYVGNVLRDVPILVENFKLKGATVNTNADRLTWQLGRRFFLVDNLSSKTQANQAASIIRYAERIQLVFKMRNSDGQIYPPYMKIKYGAVESTASSVTVSFSTQYEMDVSKIQQNVMVRLLILKFLVHIL